MGKFAGKAYASQGCNEDALADLMEVKKENRTAFYTHLQKNFESIYSSDDVTAQDVVNNISKISQS